MGTTALVAGGGGEACDARGRECAHADVVDLTGTNVKTQQPSRLLAAIVPPGRDLVLHAQGVARVVAAQKANFDAFVNGSLKFKPDLHAARRRRLAPADGDGEPPDWPDSEDEAHPPTGPVAERINWGALPSGWTEDPTPRIVSHADAAHRRWRKEGRGDRVAALAGEGQLLDNVNR